MYRKTLIPLFVLAFLFAISPAKGQENRDSTDAHAPQDTVFARDSVAVREILQGDATATADELPVAVPAASPDADADATAGDTATRGRKKVYLFPIHEEIMPAAVRLTERCLREATEMDADYVVIDMNTYGGLLDAADTIRTRVLNYHKPVYVFINNQAASAGALIAIAADSIWMREGASIGAATVVDQTGGALPDKYQSFMRGIMRSTAEAHGKGPVVSGGDTLEWRWHRDPRIAEAMVDQSVVVDGLIGEDKVLTMSTEEAIEWYFCEGRASSVQQVLEQAGVDDYELYEYKRTFMDILIGFLTNPAFQGVLIMLIIGGIYFELQTPGIGFPLVVAILGAVLYFAPLYIEGLAANWELLLFLAGVVLIILEIFAFPGFGVAGVLGILAVILGLTFAMIDTDILKHIPTGALPVGFLLRPIALVLLSVTAALVLSIWLGRRLLTNPSRVRNRLVLTSDMGVEEGYVAHSQHDGLVGQRGVTSTALRPAGKIMIDGRIYEATGANGLFIEKDVAVTVVKEEGGILYCRQV